jgi:hypothetical protein
MHRVVPLSWQHCNAAFAPWQKLRSISSMPRLTSSLASLFPNGCLLS